MTQYAQDASALMRLPEEIAAVQSELHGLDDELRAVAHKKLETEAAIEASHTQEHALQQDIHDRIVAISGLDLQCKDLLALLTARQQQRLTDTAQEDTQVKSVIHSRWQKRVHPKYLCLLKQLKAGRVRQQIQHASTAFAALCSKFEQRYHHAKLDKASAECEAAQAQLQSQLAQAQSHSHKQQQQLKVLRLIEHACQQDTNKLQVSLRGQQLFRCCCPLPVEALGYSLQK